MGLISADSLKANTQYYDNKVKLKIVHYCPLDGLESDPKCKRIVVTTDCSLQRTNERYLVVVFYGCYAKTPFKKSTLKLGQLFTLHRFETGLMPSNRVFKCNGRVIKNFFEALILVKSEYEPTIKMLVSLREETFVASNDNESAEDIQTEPINDKEVRDQRVTPVMKSVNVRVNKRTKTGRLSRSPATKKLKFDSTDEESNDSSDEETDTTSKRSKRSSNNKKNLQKEDKINGLNRKVVESKGKTDLSQQRNSQRSYEYKTLLEVHRLMPVSGKTYCHTYGILRYRDFKQNILYLRDERTFTFTVHMRPGNCTFRDYPAAKPADILRIHRILLAPNTMDIICTDPKDVVVFEGFDDSESFSPIHSSLKPTFEDFDKNRKQELEEWFANEMLENECLSEKKATEYSSYTEMAVQVLRVTTSRDRSYLEVWDTTRPSLKTFKDKVSTFDMNLNESEEELIRIINENKLSILVTVYEQHSTDAQSLKPFDFIFMSNVNIRTDKYNKDCYTYNLHSRYDFGKCIRFVKPNSCLGKKFSARIEEYKVMSAVNVSHHLTGDQFPSPSLPIDLDDNQNEVLREIQVSALENESLMDEEFELRCNLIDFKELHEISKRKQMYLPTVREVVIPDKTILIDKLLKEGADSQLYKVKARVVNYIQKEKEDIISICCSNSECLRLITLRQAIREDPLLMSTIESSTDQKLLLNCFKCKQKSSLLVFKILLTLEDNRRNKMMVELFGRNAELFLKRTPEDVLHEESNDNYMKEFFKYFCPKKYTLDSRDSYNVLIHWVIQPLKLGSKDIFRYLVRTGIAIETSDKCIGHNLNNT